MKNILFCFDVGGAGSASQLVGLLKRSDDQVVWQDGYTQGNAFDVARAAIANAYGFLSRTWEPGDLIFVFGSGRGGYQAHALAHLLGTVGVLAPSLSDLVDFALNAYGLPRTPRLRCDWWRVRQLIDDLSGEAKKASSATFLGTWGAIRVPGLPPLPSNAPIDVTDARHALAIDGGSLHWQIMPAQSPGTQTLWFRGDQRDIAGGDGACRPLTGIAVDWILDGALAAGARLRSDAPGDVPVPSHADAFAGSAHGMLWRRTLFGATVHASVAAYLQAHPTYRRRLPSDLTWADAEWLARGERLVKAVKPLPTPAGDLESMAS